MTLPTERGLIENKYPFVKGDSSAGGDVANATEVVPSPAREGNCYTLACQFPEMRFPIERVFRSSLALFDRYAVLSPEINAARWCRKRHQNFDPLTKGY